MKTTVRLSKFALQISCMLNIHLNFTRQTFAPYGTLRTWILSIHCRVMTFGGLALIALGTGGIKPCVAAFGGDQFQDHQVRASIICTKSIMYVFAFQLLEASSLQVLFHLLLLYQCRQCDINTVDSCVKRCAYVWSKCICNYMLII